MGAKIPPMTLLSFRQCERRHVDFAEGDDSLSFGKGATNATVVAAGGNDTVVAALTSLEAQLRLQLVILTFISVLSLSTLTAGSGADSINLEDGISSEVYTTKELISSPLLVMQPHNSCWW